MKNLLLLIMATVTMVSCQSLNSTHPIKTQVDSVSYLMGASDGDRLITSFEKEKLDTLLNLDLYFKGLSDASTEAELKYDPETESSKVEAFFQEYQVSKMAESTDTTGLLSGFTPDVARVDSISYIMGASDGQGMIKGFADAGLDTTIVFELYLEGLFATGKGEESRIPVEENMQMIKDFFQKLQESRKIAEESKINEQFAQVKTAGEEFLAQNKGVDGIVETASGLQYEVMVEGKGPKPTINNTVKVHYHGTLIDGTVFDSSVDRGEPTSFPVGRVIAGWTEALQLMPVGSKWKLYIPQDIAYGANPRAGGPIEPFAALIFEVELLSIEK